MIHIRFHGLAKYESNKKDTVVIHIMVLVIFHLVYRY